MSFSFLLRVIRGRQVSNPIEGVEQIHAAIFPRARRVRRLSSARSPLARSTNRSGSRRSSCRMRSQGLDVLVQARRPDLARHWRLPCPSSSAPSRVMPVPSALVLVPTRELAAQVTAELESLVRAKGLKVAAVYGGVPLRRRRRRAKSAHILIATPGRLEDLAERRLVDLSKVRVFVLDEADRMLDMGFQPQVDKHRPPAAAQPPDDVLLGHARRPGRRAGARLHQQPLPDRRRRLSAGRSRARSSTISSR